jgi:dihydrodipicolinate synthase/N-acetylneuraminate lyase
MVDSTLPVRYPRVMLGTCVVPWREDDSCDESIFRRTISDAARNLTPHLYLFGTAGEGHAVTDRQFAAVTRVFVDEMRRAGGAPMVGVISLSLGTMIERIEFARDLGVREFQISLPSWGALNDAELDRFFADTCGRFPDLSFLHYNLGRARRILTAADYRRLATRHPNLVAIKMSGEIEALRSVARAVPMVRCFFTEFGFSALADEVQCGLLCALSVCAPALGHRLFSGTVDERASLDVTYRAIHTAVKAAVGSEAHMDGAYDKLFVKYRFPEFPLRLLPPYRGANEERFAAFRAACDATLAPLTNQSPAPAPSNP